MAVNQVLPSPRALDSAAVSVWSQVSDDGRRVAVRLGKGARAGGVGGAVVTSSPDVQTVFLESPERHPFLVLSSSAVPLKVAELLALAEDFPLQPRAFCGEVASRASEMANSPCTAVQVNFLPEHSTQAEGHPPAAKKARVAHVGPGPSGVASELILVKATQSMRLRHILVKFHEGAKPAEDPKAAWASRTRAEAERLLRSAITEIRRDRKSWTKTPKDVTELISLSSKKFIELCRKLSDCETAQKGALACGDLGWVAPEARAAMSEHFKEVCDILQPGQWSDIVASHQGLHLVQRVA
ncbi:PIN1 [Symbiodinium natans]|uniref:peptidylprolyl isomerase n=1 Tax=Symbiodinium natans TaxID=878477 RepID=A0A812LB34_9DINO|nr:PIN1 [Symbiodinium natans]